MHSFRIVALTGFDEGAARARAEAVGSDGFIAKPCEPSRLVAEVQRRLLPWGGAAAHPS